MKRKLVEKIKKALGKQDYLYRLLFNANRQDFIDELPVSDLDVLIRVAAKDMPKECVSCWFFAANSNPVSCTLGATPLWESVPDDCLLKQKREGTGNA